MRAFLTILFTTTTVLLTPGCASLPTGLVALFSGDRGDIAPSDPDQEMAENDVVAAASERSGRCRRRQRDLTVAWRDRRYWCGPKPGEGERAERRPAPAAARGQIQRFREPTENRRVRQSRTASSRNPGRRTRQVTTPPQPHAASAQPSSPEHRYTRIAHRNQAQADRTVRIAFGDDRQYLLDSERSKAETRLRELVDADPAQVKVLGGCVEGESPTPDRFSVGRALAAKEVLKEMGVPGSDITILNRDPAPDAAGRYAIVMGFRE